MKLVSVCFVVILFSLVCVCQGQSTNHIQIRLFDWRPIVQIKRVRIIWVDDDQKPESEPNGPTTKERVSDLCLGCICEAISGCNVTRGCEEDDCGAFRITKRYWIDAGSPTLLLDDMFNEGAYQRCTKDPECAAKTVRGYMNRRIDKDCNNDGVVDCMDYTARHFLGTSSCTNTLDPAHESAVRNCLAHFTENKQK